MAHFVAVADEVHHLQTGQDRECALFQKIAEQGHYAGRTQPSETRQGIYAATAGGQLLGSINSRDAAAVARMLDEALERWRALSEEQRSEPVPDGSASLRWEALHPADGLVLRCVVRDVERASAGVDWREAAWNLDRVWFSRQEATALVPTPPTAGATLPWSKAVSERLVRLHLVDSVRGQTNAFARGEVEVANISSTVIAATPDRVELTISGTARARATGTWSVNNFRDAKGPSPRERGVEAELVGRAVFDPMAGRFVAFEMVAIGTRWGGTQFNGRHDDLDAAPIGWSFTLSSATSGSRLPPAHVWEYGWGSPR